MINIKFDSFKLTDIIFKAILYNFFYYVYYKKYIDSVIKKCRLQINCAYLSNQKSIVYFEIILVVLLFVIIDILLNGCEDKQNKKIYSIILINIMQTVN